MSLDKPTAADLDRRLAELLEPEPVYVHDVKQIVMAHMYGPPLRSPKGAWECRCVYEDGDVPRWVPRPFSSDWAAMGFLLEQMRERGRYLSLIDKICTYKCVVYHERDVFYRPNRAWEAQSDNPLEAMARAACKALEKEPQTKVAA